VKFVKNYDIDIIKLKEGEHDFTFKVDNEFFEHFQAEDFLKEGNLSIKVKLVKLTNLLEVNFEIDGEVVLICDRSLEEFDYPLETSEMVIYKYGSEEREISEDVFMILPDTASINVAQLIYEFILLAIPVKKIHPDYLDEMDEEDFEGDGSLIYVSEAVSSVNDDEDDIQEENKEPKTVDPRWEILKKLKNKE
jgi:uncharacterized protein